MLGRIKLSKYSLSFAFNSSPKIESYISLSVSIPKALNKINKGIFSLNEGRDTNMEPYIYFLLVIYLIFTSSSRYSPFFNLGVST